MKSLHETQYKLCEGLRELSPVSQLLIIKMLLKKVIRINESQHFEVDMGLSQRDYWISKYFKISCATFQVPLQHFCYSS